MRPPEAVSTVEHPLENTSIFLKHFCASVGLAAAAGRDKSPQAATKSKPGAPPCRMPVRSAMRAVARADAALRGALLPEHRGEGRRKDLADFPGQPGRQEAAQEMNCRSTGTRNALASRFVSFARPTTASSSMNMPSVMPFLRAAAVCE